MISSRLNIVYFFVILSKFTGKLCASYYDLIQCWPASEPGVHIRPCMEVLNGVRYDTTGKWKINGPGITCPISRVMIGQ